MVESGFIYQQSKSYCIVLLDCIRQLRLVPRAIRSDRGTENTIICGIQRFLRRNAEDLISIKTVLSMAPQHATSKLGVGGLY